MISIGDSAKAANDYAKNRADQLSKQWALNPTSNLNKAFEFIL